MLVNISRNEGRQAASGWNGDARDLAETLRAGLKGEVRFDAGSRALYATDASNYRQTPIGVVIPRDLDDVIATVRIARAFGAPILSRGGGTSLAGQCCNAAVVMDMSKRLNRVLEVDPTRKLARVEPGCVLDNLRNAAEPYHLAFGPDPATHDHCTLGGMCGNNSCGVHAQMAGRTADNIHELTVLTYDGVQMRVGATNGEQLAALEREPGRPGEIYRRLHSLRDRYADRIRERYPKIPRRVSGYNLDELLPEKGFHLGRALVGSEGTCVTILEVTAELVHSPPARALLVLGYPDVFESGDHIHDVVAHNPIGCEGIDNRLTEYMRKKGLHVENLALLPDGGGWLLVEFGGETRQEADEQANRLMESLRQSKNPPSMKLYRDPDREKLLWEVRESALGATALVPGEHDTWPGWEDSKVPPDQVGNYLRDLKKLFGKHELDNPALYGHLGQGCIHTRVPFDLRSEAGRLQYRRFLDDATDLVIAYGGVYSGEHGDGQARAEYLPKLFGDDLLEAFREFKSIWDPDGKMNPGKVVDPYRVDQNLRLEGKRPDPETHFAFAEDRHSFARATLRCVGVGKCRRESGGVMCPSFMATREEMHSTRGRTHLLFEMLEGNPLGGGWRDPHVREALDLCLSCKGCKRECPANVDVAKYKAEFLSHYYEGRLKPRHAYASGLIHVWSRLAEWMPDSANFFTQTRGLSALAKMAAGYHENRHIPAFARRSFKQRLRNRARANPDGPRVILWADTFNDHFTPQVAEAALGVLEHAGYRVLVPQKDLCCGRPLYDYGMLDRAKAWLEEILDFLRPAIRQGTPIVGLEPSCISVFRDEATDLLYGDPDAERLKRQSFVLSEFLEREDYQPPALDRKVLLHGHCHHKSVLDWESEASLLRKAGVELDVPESGCCGMAGAFGYEKERYEVSIACGERVLLPAVRQAPDDSLIVTDGFSCREQIRQCTDRRALHLAQVLQLGLREQNVPASTRQLERDLTSDAEPGLPVAAMLAAGAVIGGSALLLRNGMRRR